MKLLEYNRLIHKSNFQERAMNTQDALQEGFALYVEDNENEFLLFLYDPKKLTLDKYTELDLKQFLLQGLVASTKMDLFDNPYDCWSVNYSGAQKGWGVLLYDIMLSRAGKKGLMPDRGSVSPLAKQVWETYLTKRNNEITTKPIDDEDDPITKTKKDDGYVHVPLPHGETDLSKRSPIDRVYYLNKSSYVNTLPLEKNHLKFIDKLSQYGISKQQFLNAFDEKLVSLFYSLMKKQRSGK